MNILRDAASLQAQLRIYDGLVDSRHTLLRLRPQLRGNWVALAVAYHLNGNLVEAENVLEKYEAMLKVGFIVTMALCNANDGRA
jgi:N-alpha-acetyltransferase 15/16, NatA auxiliary subunit